MPILQAAQFEIVRLAEIRIQLTAMWPARALNVPQKIGPRLEALETMLAVKFVSFCLSQ